MALDFTHSVDIDCSAAVAFAYIADFENNPAWQSGMRACRWTSARRQEVGATYVQEARFLGRPIETSFRVTEYEPGRAIAIESTVSTFPIQVTRSVEPLGDARCRVTARVRGQPTGVLKLLAGLARRSVRKGYAALKALLERDDG